MNTQGVPQKPGQVVFTNKARCRDCYRCLRACPVKAIRVVGGQAFVEADRCIACGTCIRECPQEAKTFRNDVERAARLMAAGGVFAVSVAPSFAAYFKAEDRAKLPTALRQLGFAYVGETAIGAYEVAHATAEHINACGGGSHICTACPAVVSYVEQYEPDLAPKLTPILSPMLAHAKILKRRLGKKAKVFFIGPCVAKKAEAERTENEGLVDCVLTFVELEEWLRRAGVVLAARQDGGFDEEPTGDARFFPVPGGLARTASLHTDLLAADCLAVSGIAEVRQALDSLREGEHTMLVEPLFCPQGCVNGPGMPSEANMYVRRGELLEYAANYAGAEPIEYRSEPVDLHAEYGSNKAKEAVFTEEQIQAVFEQTGKANPDDQLNCGACGYASCRDKAIAVLRGMAVPEMCIPYMRRLAEQRSDKILESTPNGVVILNAQLELLYMNPAFRSMFQCTDSVLGKRISYLVDPEPFEQIAGGHDMMTELTARHDRYNLVCHQIVYAMRDERQYVGIFVNITNSLDTQERLKRLRAQTIRKAHELMEHQIKAAQEMAQFLGESTARSEELVRNILSMANDKPIENGGEAPWDTGTSK